MDRRFTEVELGGQKVEVPEGGYHDRFRMNPALDEVAGDPAAGNTIIRFDVVKDAQLVLNMPRRLRAFDHAER